MKVESYTVRVGRNSDVSINDINETFYDKDIIEIFCQKHSNIMKLVFMQIN